MGTVENNHALLRSGAKPGDKIFVTGTIGDAAVVWQPFKVILIISKEDEAFCESRLNYPTARLVECEIIKQYATSCIDVSDGLLQDLGHILSKSKASAVINLSLLPLSESLQKLDSNTANQFALNGGDDYELLFTIPAERHKEFITKILQLTSTQITMIGKISNPHENNQQTVGTILDSQGMHLTATGYNHFNDTNVPVKTPK